jgi:hypothetical protein
MWQWADAPAWYCYTYWLFVDNAALTLSLGGVALLVRVVKDGVIRFKQQSRQSYQP